jgi:hypothetical protein
MGDSPRVGHQMLHLLGCERPRIADTLGHAVDHVSADGFKRGAVCFCRARPHPQHATDQTMHTGSVARPTGTGRGIV